MKLKILLLLLAIGYSSNLSFGQSKDVLNKIKLVENNLHSPPSFVWKDSTLQVFNIHERMKLYNIPAVSVAVIEDSKLVWAKAYGIADKSENKPVDNNTLFQAASISKSLNGLAIMKLAENNQLDLNKDIRGYLKTWTLPENEFSKDKTITLKSLLSHTAGLSVSGFWGYSREDKIPDINEILNGRFPANNVPIKLILEPNQKVQYSGGGTVLSRKIIEDNINSNYRKLLDSTVLLPLHMARSTFYAPFETNEKNFASAYNKDGKEIPGKYHVYPEYSPDGLWTTATDLSRFVIDIQKSLKGENNSLISQKSAIEMTSPIKENSALGVYIRDFGGEKYFYHTGGNEGYSCVYIGGISNGKGVVILTNSDNGEPLYTEIMASISKVYGWNVFKAEEKTRYIASENDIKRLTGTYLVKNGQSTVSISLKNKDLYYTSADLGQHEKLYLVDANTFFLQSNPGSYFQLYGQQKIDSIVTSFRGTKLLIIPEQMHNKAYTPRADWRYLQKPSLIGWDDTRLEALKKFLIDSTSISGYMIIHKGRVAFSYGDVTENSYIASCRKSVLALLMGKYVKNGQIDLNKSLREMGINDVNPLLSTEKEATVKDIISARSGIFMQASYGGDNFHEAPPRGSKKAGSYWLYNNWDFNVAGHIFEKETGNSIYDEVNNQLAIPLQMQDFKRELQAKDAGDYNKSVYPAYPMWFSTRDMARIGQLMLNKGRWGAKQLIDSTWITEMTTAKTNFDEVNRNISDFRGSTYKFGYGYMWWLWQDANDEKYKNAYCAMGVMGQNISVFPNADVVIVYKTKAAYERSNSLNTRLKAIELGIGSLGNN
jgi:CubicO group peptidase (beta-lactamase class C family)